MARRRGIWILTGVVCLLLLGALSVLRRSLNPEQTEAEFGVYETLPADTSEEDPLLHISEDFLVDDAFSTNLPIVILTLDEEPADYKRFSNEVEIVDTDVEPYTHGNIAVIDGGTGKNCISDVPSVVSEIRIKKRGHTSFAFDKPQYLIKTVKDTEEENPVDFLGMGEGHEWILNGSLADKSMLRNYLSYRIASEVGGGAMAPDSRYCEVLLATEGGYEYRGVYLLHETVSRGKNRVNIDQFRSKNDYTSYIVRRDRFTSFDVMLDTYGRENGLSEEWIGVKYPSAQKLTGTAKAFIEEDFSRTEQVLYAEDENLFRMYDHYIDVDSFVDYFLINEFFGNYDAGEHSTYMYKNSGGKLYIGPVWDFDQAMDNYFQDEMEAETLAFQTAPLFEQLCQDRWFIDCLKERYGVLRAGVLSEDHVFSVIDEAIAYLRSAQKREWYRWAADYEDGSFTNPHNYYLMDYVQDGVTISRFNDKYDQEIYIMRTYLHKHGGIIQTELTKLYKLTKYDTSVRGENGLLLLIIMILFFVPSLLIDRKG